MVVVEGDRFPDDRDRAVIGFNSRLGPGQANAWYKKRTQTLDDLTGFPGPLYYGPTCKRSEPPQSVESVIFLLRLLRGGQTLASEDTSEG